MLATEPASDRWARPDRAGPALLALPPFLRQVRLARSVLQRLEEEFVGKKTTGRDWEILCVLGSGSASSQGQLGDALAISPSALSHRIARLEKEGLVRRSRRLADRRAVAVRCTEAGLEVLRSLRAEPGSRERLTYSKQLEKELIQLEAAVGTLRSIVRDPRVERLAEGRDHV